MHVCKFTNSSSIVRFGVVTSSDDEGMFVASDKFSPRPHVDVHASYGWIAHEPNPYVMTRGTTELLPLDTHVQWQDKRIAEIHQRMLQGTFTEWWQSEGGMRMRESLYNKYEG